MSAILRQYGKDTPNECLAFKCPGCGCEHPFKIKGDGPLWTWNGSMERPTFWPSLLVFKDRPDLRCHSMVTDGKIMFCADSHHALKGQKVDLPPID